MGAIFGRREARAHVFPEPVIPPYPGADVYGRVGVASKPDAALMVPTVWACVNLLANAVAMLPLNTYRLQDGVPKQLSNPTVVASPAAGLTQSEWLHMLMVSLLLRGNAFGLKLSPDAMERPTQIELLNPDKVTTRVDSDGSLKYLVDAGNGTQVPYTEDKIFHVRGLTLPGAKVGLSPISYAAAAVGVDLSSRQFAQAYFDGGGIPKAVLMSDRDIDQQQSSTLKQRFMAAVRGREPVVLANGLKYETIQVKPEESQFLATQQANVAQIARYFNVPAGMVGGSEGGSMTYTNVEQRSLDFLTYAVSFWLKRIEDAFFPVLPRPQYTAFDTSALLRVDAETQAKVDVQLIAARILTPTEVRGRRNLPPMTPEQKDEAGMVPLEPLATGNVKTLSAPPFGMSAPAAAPTQQPGTEGEGKPA